MSNVGYIPIVFAILGKQYVMCTSYDFVINNKNETSTCNLTIPLENVDTTIFASDSEFSNIVPVEIYSGYFNDIDQVNIIYKDIAEGKIGKQFKKRFSGYVSQPEWKFGKERLLNLACLDWTGFLREFKFADNVESNSTECSAIVNVIKSRVKGINITMDKPPGSYLLGDNDNKSNKQTYNASGKSLYDVLKDVANKLGYIITVDGNNVHLGKSGTIVNTWHFDYSNEHTDTTKTCFDDLCFRFGEKGRTDKANLVIRVLGSDHTKKGKEKKIEVIYPEGTRITKDTQVKTVKIYLDIKASEANAIAKNEYHRNAKRAITGTISIPFANNDINILDAIVIDSKQDGLNVLKDYIFGINSITETFDDNGYSQSIEFESDKTLTKRPVVKLQTKKK